MAMITKQKLAERIKKFREDLGLSQEELASKLNLPRPSISQLESGQREISGLELAKIAKIFEISVNDLLSDDLEKECKPTRKNKFPKFNKEKFKQVLLYILDKCGAKANVGETVIYKLLYFADFDFYELYEEPLTGEAYRKIDYGPAPCDFKQIIDEMIIAGEIKKVTAEYYGMPQKKYLPLVKTDVNKWNWTAREKEVVDKVIEKLSEMDAAAIKEYSHKDIPYEITKEKEMINYEKVFYRTTPYSVRSYSEE
jgi:transcriptional regulator with XRE-family HTH domain